MKQHFIIKDGYKQLLLFFAGWGMDYRPFLSIHPAECDWMMCYDYRDLQFDIEQIKGYPDIKLAAWSMGVWAASQIMAQHPELPVSASIAFNGTTYPIDETKGIAPAIFEGTWQGLNEQTLSKFQRRMCNTAADFKAFQAIAPQRPTDELKDELADIRRQYLSLPPTGFRWQKAIIGKNDRIFLPECQRTAWDNGTTLWEEVEAAHYQKEVFEEILS